jgi:uncharacterized repeat protein (TIGR03803 family)
VLHSFSGVAKGQQDGDGAEPNGGVILDGKGNIIGTTYIGGNASGGCSPAGCGRVFELRQPTVKRDVWREKVLHDFDGQGGATPAAGVIFDAKDNLYGTLYGGGPQGYGSVFELSRPSRNGLPWKMLVLDRFTDGIDGANPLAGLIFDSQEKLYGTAYRGDGTSQYGDVFRLTATSLKPEPWTLTVLHGFHTQTDGGQPASAPSIDAAGNLYGTTQYGGTGQSCQGGCGTVFKVSQ